MRFLVAFKNDRGTSLKIAMPGTDGNEKEIWMSCSQVVYGFAKKTLRGNERDSGYTGDEVKVTYTEENGKYTCTRIEKIGGTSAPQQGASTTNNAEFKCSECGKALKDGKYAKCYLCNQKNPSKPASNTTGGEHICVDCGVTLKDGKYKKCYTCNQKNPVKRTGTKSSDGKFRIPEQITRDELGHMTARTMVALAGVVDPNNVTDVMRKVYQTYKELVG